MEGLAQTMKIMANEFTEIIFCNKSFSNCREERIMIAVTIMAINHMLIANTLELLQLLVKDHNPVAFTMRNPWRIGPKTKFVSKATIKSNDIKVDIRKKKNSLRYSFTENLPLKKDRLCRM
mmetsp:Transcript_7629/g.11665  ORF Transcript_7629/g.11665 Transcript_7629/m.11665 type:complete len:121 (+) Transcript_7629:1388-1750(+)